MKVYKLTDANSQTRNNTQWGEGVTHTTDGTGDLCGSGWLHCYSHPLLAALLNPNHAALDPNTMLLWEAAAAKSIRSDHGLKLGTTSLTTLWQIALPAITVAQRVRFSILCSLQVCHNPAYVVWASAWLDGSNRTASAAYASYAAAYASGASARAADAADAAARAAYAADAADLDLGTLAEQAIRDEQ